MVYITPAPAARTRVDRLGQAGVNLLFILGVVDPHLKKEMNYDALQYALQNVMYSSARRTETKLLKYRTRCIEST